MYTTHSPQFPCSPCSSPGVSDVCRTPVSLCVREAGPEDASRLAELHREVYLATYCRLLPVEVAVASAPKDWHALWRRRFSRAVCTLTVESDRAPVGLVQAGAPCQSVAGCDAELYSIFVRPEYQGLGLGSELFRLACEALSREGYGRMGLWALASNPALAFYASRGMERVESRTVTLCGRKVHKVALARNLAFPDPGNALRA